MEQVPSLYEVNEVPLEDTDDYKEKYHLEVKSHLHTIAHYHKVKFVNRNRFHITWLIKPILVFEVDLASIILVRQNSVAC